MEHRITLDLGKSQAVPACIDARAGEKGACTLVAQVTRGGSPMPLAGYTARFEAAKPDGSMVRDAACTVSGSTVTYTLDQSAVAAPGLIAVAYFALIKGAVVETTENLAIRVLPSAESASSGVSKDYYSEIDDLIAKLEKQKSDQQAAWKAQTAKQQADWKTQADRQQADFAAAEKTRAVAEAGRASGEQARAAEESARKTEEGKRAAAEQGRASAETARSAEEGRRASAEATRESQEAARQAEEGRRTAAEGARETAETARAAADGTRAAKEAERQSAEAARAEAEGSRAVAQAKNDADQELNNAAMRKLEPYVCAAGEYDAKTLMPTVAGEPNRLYFVPDSLGPGNRYVEWMLVESAWEMMGVSKIDVSSIATSEIDDVAADKAPSGGSVLSLTGLSYLWAKVKSAFAPRSHAAGTSAYGAAATGVYGHARASTTLPKPFGRAVIGTESDAFARGDHVHPVGDRSIAPANLDRTYRVLDWKDLIVANEDLNNFLAARTCACPTDSVAATVKNCPTGGKAFDLTVDWILGNSTYKRQTVQPWNAPLRYERVTSDGGKTWGFWAQTALAPGAVGGAHLAAGAVTEGALYGGAVTAAKIADNAVTTPKIARGAVNRYGIAPAAVYPGHLDRAYVPLGKRTTLYSSDDLDSKPEGSYEWHSDQMPRHAPADDSTGGWSLDVGSVPAPSGRIVFQRAFSAPRCATYSRCQIGGAWMPWIRG